MNTIVNLKCQCGELEGTLTVVPKDYFHVHCLCCDCQQFAAYLKNEAAILDEHGGSELFQTYPQYLKITKGEDHLQCVQLKPKGLYRWYTGCCHMPIANTMASASTPFVGVSVKLMQFASQEEKRRIIGPVLMKAFGRYAVGGKPKDAYDKFPNSFIPKIIGFMMKGKLTGKASPSPFFQNRQPVVTPQLLPDLNR